jgi:hypothetical protein
MAATMKSAVQSKVAAQKAMRSAPVRASVVVRATSANAEVVSAHATDLGIARCQCGRLGSSGERGWTALPIYQQSGGQARRRTLTGLARHIEVMIVYQRVARIPLVLQTRRSVMSTAAGVASLLAAAPAFASYGDSANVFGKKTNKSGA